MVFRSEGFFMDTLDKLLQISSRLEHLESAAEWIAKEAVHDDNGISQTGTLICVLADEIREMIFSLTHELEQIQVPLADEDEETIH
jgi:hypothetical protein